MRELDGEQIERGPGLDEVAMDLELVRNEFGNMHVRMCGLLSELTAERRKAEGLTRAVAQIVARVAQLERELAEEREANRHA